MKILISTDFYMHNLGGVTTSVLALTKGLRCLGHEVKILTMSENNSSYSQGDVFAIRSFPAYYAPDMRFSLAVNDPLIERLIQWRPDIIHVQSEGSALLFARKIQRRCKIPLIMTCHTDYAYFVFGEARKRPLIKAFTVVSAAAVYYPASRIIVPSKKALHFPFLQTFKDRLLGLPNGIDIKHPDRVLSSHEKTVMKGALGIRYGQKVLAAVTRLSKEKNIQELIGFLPALLEKEPETVLMVVGDGPYEKKLKELVRKLSLGQHVIFAGRIDADEVWRYYAISDVFVSASLFELHSMSYLEALSLGLPLLCRDDEALDGVLIDGYNGMRYRTRKEFVEKARKILRNDGLRNKMSQASLKKAKGFTCESFAANALKIYEDTIRDREKVKLSSF
ncbi:MAG: glycosyltransferase [Erysipelotrichaceae bacterium]|nr:glycosyltransferase [Erysipelotrichaceae bacterium]